MIIQESQKVVTKSNDDVVYLVEEWKTVWQSKVLSYGDREAKSLSTKLSGINFLPIPTFMSYLIVTILASCCC